MSRIGIVYGSSTGKTHYVAQALRDELGAWRTEIVDVRHASSWDLKRFSTLILGTSTWDEGSLQADWQRFLSGLRRPGLDGKRVALFGLGDAQRFPEHFVDAMGELAEWAISNGGRLVGRTQPDGLEFEASAALRDGELVGLAIDEHNQRSSTRNRLRSWARQLEQELN